MSADADAWVDLSEALVRGLAHALSNRVVSLGMAGDGLDDEEPEVRAAARAQVVADADRLAEITRLLKLLPREGEGRPQALQVPEVLSDALALHAHHLELRDVPVTTSISVTALPVRVERWALLRALLLLLDEARRDARARGDGGGVSIVVEGTEEETVIRADGVAGDGRIFAELAARCGGRAGSGDTGTCVVLPSLTALRRREGRTS